MTSRTGVRRVACRLMSMSVLVGACCCGCPRAQDGTIPAIPWPRHTIDDSFNGADGVRIGDLNGDGLIDVVVPWEESGVVVVYINPGAAASTLPWDSVVVGRVASVEDAVFVDLDDDGMLDVVSCTEGGNRTIYVHWAPADAARLLDENAWQTAAISTTQDAAAWMYCEPAQIDQQHGVDLVAGAKDGNGQVGWLEAPANPRDLSAWTWHKLADADWIMSAIPVDMNDDGALDIAFTDRKGSNRGTYWLQNPGATLTAAAPWTQNTISSADEAVMFMDLADVDADGVLDAVTATNRRELIWYRQQQLAVTIWTPTRIALSAGYGTTKSVCVADLDLDGNVDIVFTCENAGGKIGVGWARSIPVGSAVAWSVQPISDAAGSKFDLVQTVDLDGDGDLDVLTCEESAGLGVVWYANPAIR